MANLTTIGPPAGRADFRGYYIREDAQWDSLTCGEGEAWYTKRNFGLCCATTATDCVTAMVTSCSGNFPVATTAYTCGDGQACRSVIIYDQFPMTGSGDAITNIVCAEPAWSVGVMFRTVQSPLLAAVATPTDSAAASTSSAAVTSNPTAKSTSPPTGSASAAALQSSGSNSSASHGWIAGAVIGPILALSLIAGLAFWIYRLRRRVERLSELDSASRSHGSYGAPVHEVDDGAKKHLTELPAVKENQYELPAPHNQYPVHNQYSNEHYPK